MEIRQSVISYLVYIIDHEYPISRFSGPQLSGRAQCGAEPMNPVQEARWLMLEPMNPTLGEAGGPAWSEPMNPGARSGPARVGPVGRLMNQMGRLRLPVGRPME